ncbi:MAG: hypothetical protein JRJ37_07295 [Deltaproteobacteria bacterium]|nr:hypothetical protein [Deltaproteobacteria bacterium]
MAKVTNIIIAVKDVDKAKQYFLDMGMKVKGTDWTVPPGTEPGHESLPGLRRVCMLVDDDGFGIEIAQFDDVYPYAKGTPIVFEVDNTREAYDAFKNKDGVREVAAPGSFGMEDLANAQNTSGSWGMVAVDLGRTDGEEIVVEFCHHES